MVTAIDHETMLGWLTQLKFTAICHRLDVLLDEAARKDLTMRETLAPLCEREIARKDERRVEMAMKIAIFGTPVSSTASTSRINRVSTRTRSETSLPPAGLPMARPSCCWSQPASASRTSLSR